jgi:hypothetical protein
LMAGLERAWQRSVFANHDRPNGSPLALAP